MVGLGGPEYSLDDGHVLDRAFEGYGQFGVFADALREQISLDRVLVDNVELDDFGAAAGRIGSIVNKDSAWFVRRRIERDLDFDPAFGAEDLYLLIRYELGAAGKDAVPRRIVKNS